MAIGTISSPASWSLGTVAAASWFQNVQDNINGWIAGTGSAMANLQISGTAGGTALPTTVISRGTMSQESVLLACCYIHAAVSPTVNGAFNIASLSRSSAGSYTITMNSAGTSTSRIVAIGSISTAAGFITTLPISSTQIAVATGNTSNVATDIDFSLLVFST